MGTDRLGDANQAWWAVEEWLAQDAPGRAILAQLRVDPEAGARALAERLRGADVPALAATWASGGNIGKLVTIARAERVSIAGRETGLAGPRDPSGDLVTPVPRQLPVAARHFAGRVAELEALTALMEETAGAAVFLASPASDFMTGADLIVDGGFFIR